jgi:hypothetical protein
MTAGKAESSNGLRYILGIPKNEPRREIGWQLFLVQVFTL